MDEKQERYGYENVSYLYDMESMKSMILNTTGLFTQGSVVTSCQTNDSALNTSSVCRIASPSLAMIWSSLGHSYDT